MKIKTILTTLSAIIALAVFAMNTVSQSNAFVGLQNAGATVNSVDTELLPVIAPNGLSLYFASNRVTHLPAITDIWVSQRATLSSPWGMPQIVTVLNTDSAESITGISPDGREMFIQSQRPGGMGGADLYISTRPNANDDFGWTTPVHLGAVLNTTSDDSLATYFVDPATGAGTLFFSSDRGNTAGNRDVYQSTRNVDGTFNAPTLIPELNSAFDDSRLTIRRDGLELFFASTRLGPGNTFTVFTSTRASVSAPWSAPAVVASLNTTVSNSQPTLSPDGSILYFVSNRVGGIGGGDLYSTMRCSLYAASPCSINRNTTTDFDGDGRTDLSVFRPSDGTWHILNSDTNTYHVQPFGLSGDKVVSGDYDGDGRTDLAVFRPSTGVWWISRSSSNTVSMTNWGLATDKLVPDDYDGDGKTDIAVYRDGTWYIQQSSNGSISYRQFGLSSDIPIGGVNQ